MREKVQDRNANRSDMRGKHLQRIRKEKITQMKEHKTDEAKEEKEKEKRRR
jgi:hypothetical protein